MQKQQKAKKMTNSKYKKYLKLQHKAHNDDGFKEEWQPILKYVPLIEPDNLIDWSAYRKYKIRITHEKYNNKEVMSNAAIWIDCDVLLRGYILKNTNILRPIFQVKREVIQFNARQAICSFAKIFAANARDTLYTKALLEYTQLPLDVIDIIIQMSRDILLLLR